MKRFLMVVFVLLSFGVGGANAETVQDDSFYVMRTGDVIVVTSSNFCSEGSIANLKTYLPEGEKVAAGVLFGKIVSKQLSDDALIACGRMEPPPIEIDFIPVRVNVGGPAYQDINLVTWQEDNGCNGSMTQSIGRAIAGTDDSTIFQSGRYDVSLHCQYSVPNGSYTVTVYSSENYYKAIGKREFDITINSVLGLAGLDMYAQVGVDTAVSKSFTVDVTNGLIDINADAVVDAALIRAIEITCNAPCVNNTGF